MQPGYKVLAPHSESIPYTCETICCMCISLFCIYLLHFTGSLQNLRNFLVLRISDSFDEVQIFSYNCFLYLLSYKTSSNFSFVFDNLLTVGGLLFTKVVCIKNAIEMV